jgi:50S ribosomal protein L16 3-hydroxylase
LIRIENFDPALFLRDYWQRKPLLIRQALPGFTDPLSAEELAGLALEEEFESRLVETRGSDWHFEQGPLADDSFQRDNPWTVLVQAVDQHHPGVAQLRQLISFLPQWRIDDVMVSYATAGGGVGPHYDNYDVFLLQGMGQRRWQIGQACLPQEPLLDHDQLRILADFQQTEEYLLEAGDILYLPPRLAHWGTALGDCLTYSIGLRAPRLNDMLSRWLDQVLEGLDPEGFYTDPPLTAAKRAGELSSQAINSAINQLQSALANRTEDPRWLGELVTEPRYEPMLPAGDRQWTDQDPAQLCPAARLAWSQQDGQLWVFANGSSLAVEPACQSLVEALCAGDQVYPDCQAQRELLAELYQLGCIDDI